MPIEPACQSKPSAIYAVHMCPGMADPPVCVVQLALCVMHIQTMHPKTHRATYILARGLMNAENPVGP